jgi:signal peptidase I
VKGFWRGTAWFVAIVGAIALLLYLFVFDTWVVPGDDPMLTVSVEPTLRPGDRILTRRGSSPHIGELARCRSPLNVNKYVVGRVFGMDGDSVEIKSEGVWVGGKAIPRPRSCPGMSLTHPATGEIIPLTCGEEDNPAWTYRTLRAATESAVEPDVIARVETGKVFLVSDNRHLHQDSRDLGQVDAASCEHVVFRLWGESYVDSSRRNTILW